MGENPLLLVCSPWYLNKFQPLMKSPIFTNQIGWDLSRHQGGSTLPVEDPHALIVTSPEIIRADQGDQWGQQVTDCLYRLIHQPYLIQINNPVSFFIAISPSSNWSIFFLTVVLTNIQAVNSKN